ncbi:MAG: glycosyltransferase family 39 protein [Bacteroidales bacterium]|nr:glycosyltransferase family 39 protein [Bacteroidales bacterium]
MRSYSSYKVLFTDIRFWILIFFLIRLIGITNPPLEIGHNWRQCLTNMVARNFLETDANILYPRIDMGGNRTGIIGTEFPLFNYLIYLVSLLFDYTHWYGRLINLVVSSIGIYYFSKLVELLTDKKTALYSGIILLSSIWFAFSRKIMPDTFSVALVIIGLYAGFQFLLTGKARSLIFYFFFITLGMLCKIPALSLVSVVGLVLIIKQIEITRKILIVSVTALSVLVVSSWYFYWVPYLVDTYRYQLYFPKGFAEGFMEITPLIPEFLEKFYFSSLNSYIAFGFFLAGIFFLIRKNNLLLNSGLLVITGIFLVFTLKTGSVFPLHNYYIIPFTPIMAFIAGFGLKQIPGKFGIFILLLIAIEGIANQQHDFFINKKETYKPGLEQIVQKHIPEQQKILINGGPSPQEIYFAHRKGWTSDNSILSVPKLDSLAKLGAAFLVINKHTYPDHFGYYPLIFDDNDYSIYRLKKNN